MGRIRTIKPEFFKHSELYDAEIETGLPLRVAYAGLWTCCDREGRFKWRPRSLKLDVLPYDDCDFSRVLDALITRGFVVRYASEDDEFGYIPTFLSHQVINNRESQSVLPNPNECKHIDASATRDPRDEHAPSGEGKGREGKGINTSSLFRDGDDDPPALTEKQQMTQDLNSIWEAYCDTFDRQKDYAFSDTRRRHGEKGWMALKKRAKQLGIPEDQQQDAIFNWFSTAIGRLRDSRFHNGGNERNAKYNDWENLFRSPERKSPDHLTDYWLDDKNFKDGRAA